LLISSASFFFGCLSGKQTFANEFHYDSKNFHHSMTQLENVRSFTSFQPDISAIESLKPVLLLVALVLVIKSSLQMQGKLCLGSF